MAPKEETIPIDSLDPAQLANIKERISQEIEKLTTSAMQLQRAANLYANSGLTVDTVAESKEGKPLLLPLTESLYVSGSLADSEHVLVDIGTNYYVEMTTSEGKDFCNRKVDKLRDNIENLRQVIKQKNSALMQISAVLQEKMATEQSGTKP